MFEKAFNDIQKVVLSQFTYIEVYLDYLTKASIKEAIYTSYPKLNKLIPLPYKEIN